MARKDMPVAKLGWELDGEFTFESHAGPNRLAAEALRVVVEPSLEPKDLPVAVMVEMLAEAVDADPTNAALWGQYRSAYEQLRGLSDHDDDEFDKLLPDLSAAEVRHPAESEPAD